MATERFELSIERRIDAPVERVWHVMTARLEEWFCPAPWRAEARDLEGGRAAVA